ncbi:MAG: hypothetical protein FJX75_23350 [Armatimonadetes bacterium]|nr:hypothetical protein [Armatimonadota bacterium]
MLRIRVVAVLLLTLLPVGPWAVASVYNLRVVTDASPDYTDLDSMIHSITANWQTPEEKLWAMFYWNHIARRQCSPMMVHGLACSDPIRQFNDYGYTMCSTIAGVNCAIWDAMGLRMKYWDITNHTVPEVEYGGRCHMYDNSLSALYTLCDGKTIAGVEDIGRTQGCVASGGVEEPGHIAKRHCLTATSPNGFLTGSDTARDLDQEYRCFNPNGLKYRYYYHDWDRGHRYILNLRGDETYTRYYGKRGDAADQYVPLNDKDPDDGRFGLRGNGLRTFTPRLTPGSLALDTVGLSGVRALDAAGVVPNRAGEPGEVVFKVEGANVITSLTMQGAVYRKSPEDTVGIAFSTTNGLSWHEVWTAPVTGDMPLHLGLVGAVSGAYEVLVKVTLQAKVAPTDAQLRSIRFEATTMLNAKTQPQLLPGRNTVYVDAGEQLGSIVLWPDLQGEAWKPYVVAHENMVSEAQHPGYMGVMHAVKPDEDAYVVFRLDAPGDLKRVTYGGRLYNRAPKAHIDLLHSFDDGKTWTTSYSLTDTEPPWDVIHYVTVEAPPGRRSVLMKYLLNGSAAGTNACSLYAVRMQANYQPADAGITPLAVTFDWSERQADRSLVERRHTQVVSEFPAKYVINVGGEDVPVVNWLWTGPPRLAVKPGHFDSADVGGEKFRWRWATYGANLAVGKPYTVSLPSNDNWGAGDPEGKKLTDGVVGPPMAGGVYPTYSLGWNAGQTPEITVDLGSPQTCAAFRIGAGGGWPWWDGLKGEVQDKVEVFTSLDGTQYTSCGRVDMNPRRKDIPINHMLPDDETLTAYLFTLAPPQPVQARYVRFAISAKRMICVSEVQALDSLKYEPFDLRIALPDERRPDSGEVAQVVTPSGRPMAAALAAKNVAEPVGEPVLEDPTLHSLGAYWIVRGDENRNARVAVRYREAGGDWKPGPPLFRVEKGAHKDDKGQSTLTVPDDGWLFAGSVLLLKPDTEYELELSLSDPDGGAAQRALKARTNAEPTAPADMRVRHVTPGNGGGSGTEADPFRGLAAAQATAEPGDLFIVHAGVYEGTFTVDRSGEPGKPIIWRGEGEAILDGQGAGAARPGRVVSASNVHDVWFEDLTLRNGDYGLVGHNSARIVVRRCHIQGVDYGLTCTNNSEGGVRGFFISDNLIEGPSTWPRTQGIENARGIQMTGSGHDVCYNRIRGFADAIDTFPSVRCAGIDFHHNDISEMTDDGIEMDYSERNTRCFLNRLTNVFQGISEQPIYGGPVYIFRNVLYNVQEETFKLHNSPSGALVFHNTSVKSGMPLVLYTNEPVRNCVLRNNLFIGTGGNYAFESTAPMVDCDFDYDGFGGGPWGMFLKWNGTRYGTFDEMRQTAPVYRHAVLVDPATVFASGVRPPETFERQVPEPPDLRLAPGTTAIDAGESLPGVNDGFAGAAPDLGAYELGAELPHYGPR